MTATLWAITSYFNPLRFERRRSNYRLFRKHLGVPLVAVELGYDGCFELDEGDAEILLRIPGRDVLWQKERLLNLAVEALPAGCTQVAWIDGDVILGDDRWFERVDESLSRFSLVRPYAEKVRAPRDWTPAPAVFERRPEPAAAVALEAWTTHPDGDTRPYPARPYGCAWVARRQLLEAHGLYDGNIVGGGDLAMVMAAWGLETRACQIQRMNAERRRHYLAWARPFGRAVAGNVGHLRGRLYSLWHGDEENRRYAERHRRLEPYAFDPAIDLELGPSGCWQWASRKPDMHAFVRDYLASRREDG